MSFSTFTDAAMQFNIRGLKKLTSFSLVTARLGKAVPGMTTLFIQEEETEDIQTPAKRTDLT